MRSPAVSRALVCFQTPDRRHLQRTRRIPPAIVVLAAVATAACASRPAYPNDDVIQTETQLVLAAEDAYVAAEVSRDESALRRLVDDKFVFNAANGSTSGKEEPGRPPRSSRLRYTAVYVKRGGSWRMRFLSRLSRVP
jgi:hypothetical protein